jgi:hypothetical protein
MTTESEQRTIKELADQTRQDAVDEYGEAEFSRLCLQFDQQVPAGTEAERLVAVLELIMAARDAKTRQLASVWLDDHGYFTHQVGALQAGAEQIKPAPALNTIKSKRRIYRKDVAYIQATAGKIYRKVNGDFVEVIVEKVAQRHIAVKNNKTDEALVTLNRKRLSSAGWVAGPEGTTDSYYTHWYIHAAGKDSPRPAEPVPAAAAVSPQPASPKYANVKAFDLLGRYPSFLMRRGGESGDQVNTIIPTHTQLNNPPTTRPKTPNSPTTNATARPTKPGQQSDTGTSSNAD